MRRYAAIGLAVALLCSCIPIPKYTSSSKTQIDTSILLGETTREEVTRILDKEPMFHSDYSRVDVYRDHGIGGYTLYFWALIWFLPEDHTHEESRYFVFEYDKADKVKYFWWTKELISVYKTYARYGDPVAKWELERRENRFDIDLLCKVVQLRHPRAIQFVGKIFLHGWYNYERDPVKSYVWYRAAEKYRQPDVASITSIKAKLSPEQLILADQLYDTWEPWQCEQDLRSRKRRDEGQLRRADEDISWAIGELYQLSARSDSEILESLCKGADKGISEAQWRLANIFYYGWYGVAKDRIRSYMWYRLASTGSGMWSDWAGRQLETGFNDFMSTELTQAEVIIADWEPGQCERDLVPASSGN